MKKIKDTIYGFSVVIVALTNVLYLCMLFYNGISNVENYSIEGSSLFIYVLLSSIVILRYPVKICMRNIAQFLNNNTKQKKPQKITNKQNQKKAA